MSAVPLAYPDATIRDILDRVKTIALVGASAKSVRPSYFVLKYLLAKGYRVIPVNPGLAGQDLLGQRCYADLSSIPEPIDMVDIFRGADAVPGIVDEALALDPKPKVIWMQLTVRHDEAHEYSALGRDDTSTLAMRKPGVPAAPLFYGSQASGLRDVASNAARPKRVLGGLPGHRLEGRHLVLRAVCQRHPFGCH